MYCVLTLVHKLVTHCKQVDETGRAADPKSTACGMKEGVRTMAKSAVRSKTVDGVCDVTVITVIHVDMLMSSHYICSLHYKEAARQKMSGTPVHWPVSRLSQ